MMVSASAANGLSADSADAKSPGDLRAVALAAGTHAGSIHAAHKCKTPIQLTIDMIGQKQ